MTDQKDTNHEVFPEWSVVMTFKLLATVDDLRIATVTLAKISLNDDQPWRTAAKVANNESCQLEILSKLTAPVGSAYRFRTISSWSMTNNAIDRNRTPACQSGGTRQAMETEYTYDL